MYDKLKINGTQRDDLFEYDSFESVFDDLYESNIRYK